MGEVHLQFSVSLREEDNSVKRHCGITYNKTGRDNHVMWAVADI